MHNSTPDGVDSPPLRELPNLRTLSLSELAEWMLADLDECRRELRAKEVRRVGLEMRIDGLEQRERDREGGQ